MPHAINLAIVCFVVWLLLSGHYVPLILTFGVVATLIVVAITSRMDVANREGQPVHLLSMILSYWPWLVWQIVKANLMVVRCIVSPSLPIRPTLVSVRASQKSTLGKVVYANSITLTPGTVAIDIEGNKIQVHALIPDAAQDLKRGIMDRRVTRWVETK